MTTSDTITLDTPTEIEGFRVLSIRGMLKLELSGMTHSSRVSAIHAARQLLELPPITRSTKGAKLATLRQLEDWYEEHYMPLSNRYTERAQP